MSVDYTRFGDQRRMSATWDSPLVVDGHEIDMEMYPRYDNRFANVEWGNRLMTITSNNCELSMDFSDLGDVRLDSYCRSTTPSSAVATESSATTTAVKPITYFLYFMIPIGSFWSKM